MKNKFVSASTAIDYSKTTTFTGSVNVTNFCTSDAHCTLTQLCVGLQCTEMSALPGLFFNIKLS